MSKPDRKQVYVCLCGLHKNWEIGRGQITCFCGKIYEVKGKILIPVTFNAQAKKHLIEDI